SSIPAGEPAEGVDPGIGVAAMRKVVSLLPDDVPSLLLTARLLSAQRVWAEARATLLHAIEVARDAEPKITAHFMLTDLYEGAIRDLALAQASLQAILALDESNRRALDRLHQIAIA